MSAKVHPTVVRPDESLVRAGSPVSARTWQPIGMALNSINGAGRMLVPFHMPGNQSFQKGTSYDFVYRVEPSPTALARMWVVEAHPNASAGGFTLTAGSDTVTGYTARSLDDITPVLLRENLTTQSSTQQSITLNIDTLAGADLRIKSIGCWEIPRTELQANTTDYGVTTETLGHRAPIYADGGAGTCIRGCDDALYRARLHTRRHLLNMSFGEEVGSPTSGAYTNATTTYTRILATDLPMLARMHFRGLSVRPMSYKIRAAHSAGAVACQLRVTMTNGDTTTSTFTPGTTLDWYPSTAAEVDVHTEDLTAADGRRSSTWDVATIEARLDPAGAGTGTLYVTAVSVWEAAANS